MSTFDVSHEAGRDDAHAWLLTVSGDFDLQAIDRFDAAFDDAVTRGARLVTLDLSGVEFIDSSGLRSVVRAANELARLDGHLTVAGLSGAAQRVLEVSGLIEHLTARDRGGSDGSTA